MKQTETEKKHKWIVEENTRGVHGNRTPTVARSLTTFFSHHGHHRRHIRVTIVFILVFDALILSIFISPINAL